MLIVAQLGPQQGTSLLPYILLTVTGQLFFYLGLCRYFATGVMREPYINHLWNYVFCLFLGLSVCIGGVGVLEEPRFQFTYTLLVRWPSAAASGPWRGISRSCTARRSPLFASTFGSSRHRCSSSACT
ncbi:hypothetical protein STIAU_5249 [Stigmatella aurantiaca DW4/3-1]|uniref:Uncharacterized protein n=1 Tax=Stigmatella aurantiaca (strain DW4/3-1) TaxID=378806 RepID=Q08PL3_STIAD|nr:hypothetical protein STIAU_5249 [Stigmatella aurantiaca DW4/3-1]